MEKLHRQIRLLMVLVYIAFGLAFRITMITPANEGDSHPLDLAGDFMTNYDILADIVGARSIVNGSFDMYVGRYSKDAFPPDGVAISYPPLMSYLQAPIVFVGNMLGLRPYGIAMMAVCGCLYVVLSALCALQAGKVLKSALNVTDELAVTATVFLLLFSSLMFWVATYTARFEFVAALFLLFAITSLAAARYGWAGVSLGLALMTKQTVLPAVVVFLTVAMLNALRKEITLRQALCMLAALPLPFAMLIPFWLASPHDLWVGLFGTPDKVSIMRVSFINLVLQAGTRVFSESALREFLGRYSNSILLVLCVGFVLIVAVRKRVRLGTSEFCALVALASFVFPVLAKYTNITRYAAVASVFVVLWGASRRPGFPYDALWFVVLQSFILDHVPAIWKDYVGLIFYAAVFLYVYCRAFVVGDDKVCKVI